MIKTHSSPGGGACGRRRIGWGALLLASGLASSAWGQSVLVDLDAADAGQFFWPNRGTLGGEFAEVGLAVDFPTIESINGVPCVTLKGGGEAYSGPITPAELEGASPCTIEVWVYNPSLSDEETVVAWGKRGGPDGSNMSFNYGGNATWGAVGHWGAPDMGWGGSNPAPGYWHYLVYTYNGTTAIVYDNGLEKYREDMVLAIHPLNPINIGAQNDAAGAPQAALSGSLSIASVKIRDYALTDVQIAQGFNDGAGAMQGIKLNASSTELVVGGVADLLPVGVYATIGETPLPGGQTTFASSNPEIATVDANGVVRGVDVGTATITGTYGASEATVEITVQPLPPAQLAHRWSFNDAPGSLVADDSVGGADGQLMGNAYLEGGRVHLDGSKAPQTYVDLPNGIISALENLTVELWLNRTHSGWQRAFDFGDNSTGSEDPTDGTALTSMFLAPGMGDNGAFRFAMDGGPSEQPQLDSSPSLPEGEDVYVACVYNYSQRRMSVYVNGVLRATASNVIYPLSALNDVNNWLGRSQYSADANLIGSIDEVRIWDGPLTAEEAYIHYLAGPDATSGDLGALTALRFDPASGIAYAGSGGLSLSVIADFEQAQGVNATAFDSCVIESMDSAIATINDLKQAVGVAPGTVQIRASYGGLIALFDLTVAPIPEGNPTLAHRYSFSEGASQFVAEDSAGGADGTLMGLGAVFDGAGQIVMDGVDGYVDLPNGMISALGDATFEVWGTFSGQGGAWQRVWDFGTMTDGEDGAGSGLGYLFLCPRTGTGGPIRFAIKSATGGETPILESGATMTPNAEQHVVLTYNYTARLARLYVDGVQVAAGPVTYALSVIDDVNNWLGRSNYAADAYYQGSLNEFRIWNGVMTAAEVVASRAAGPDDLPEPVAVLSISLSGGQVSLSWTGGGTLQESSTLAPGGWTNSANQANPQTIVPTAGQRYYRIRQQ
ncbi:MAG: Ig-like domain-containing protein [Verrucomicrobiales bacterium]|nr:Ig-like domain-containing protein [Verrucomicrobiales bacterium]